MHRNKETAAVIDNGAYTIYRNEEVKTGSEATHNSNTEKIIKGDVKKKTECIQLTTATIWAHYFTLIILGGLAWGLLWCSWGAGWRWDGRWFRLAAVGVAAWAAGRVLQALTTLPPLLAALLLGILARNIGLLDMREFLEIDGFLRKIYPVVILGKASLGWDVGFMRSHWVSVAALGAAPWAVEVATVAACAHFLLDFPWSWGLLLGSIYASLSCAVVMPGVARVAAASDWPRLVCTAGGVDTALAVGVYGLVFSFMFHPEGDVYKYVKAGTTLFVGLALGVAWGCVARAAPHAHDPHVAELRVLVVLGGGLFANFVLLYFGWAGTAGVAVLACNATAATYWAKDGWELNNNPASTAYRVLWAALEPILFAYTGTFFVIEGDIWDVMLIGLGVLCLSLAVRLAVAALVCWHMSLKERLFICCTWIPKSIVEAVLGPLALTTVLARGAYEGSGADEARAETLLRLLVQAILITTPAGFLLTNHLGPKLLKMPKKIDCENTTDHSFT